MRKTPNQIETLMALLPKYQQEYIRSQTFKGRSKIEVIRALLREAISRKNDEDKETE